MEKNTLYANWARTAYDNAGTGNKKFWDVYLPLEQRVYEDLLERRENRVYMPLMAFAEKYGMKPEYVCGFLDGINGALNEQVDAEAVDTDYIIDICFEFDRLLQKMVEYKAEHLYNLPQWQGIFDAETYSRLIDEQKRSGTFVRGGKTGRNEPCPCGSGRKFKHCCGGGA